MLRIGIESTHRAERPDKIAEGEKIHKEPNRRDSNGKRQKSGKRGWPAKQEPGAIPADHESDLGKRVDFEA